jgi:hypothetical protein
MECQQGTVPKGTLSSWTHRPPSMHSYTFEAIRRECRVYLWAWCSLPQHNVTMDIISITFAILCHLKANHRSLSCSHRNVNTRRHISLTLKVKCIMLSKQSLHTVQFHLCDILPKQSHKDIKWNWQVLRMCVNIERTSGEFHILTVTMQLHTFHNSQNYKF